MYEKDSQDRLETLKYDIEGLAGILTLMASCKTQDWPDVLGFLIRNCERMAQEVNEIRNGINVTASE